MQLPQYPIGPFQPEPILATGRRTQLIAEIQCAPAALRTAVVGLSDEQLNTCYKNWTVRQIVHHVADSHVHSYIRFKWTLTEERPTIKAYEEGDWAALADSRTGDVSAPLALLEALHARWVQLLNSLSEEQFTRSFVHPQTGEVVSLNMALGYYVWHGKHHTAQIQWLREHHDW
jgi:uncharacterized damage-inducible protein DinB